MDNILQLFLIVIALSIPPLIAGLINYFLQKKKVEAETENIKLKNKITKDITYGQLKKENENKNIKSKIDILQRIIVLEEEIKNKEQKTTSDQKKIESLEMIKKEFKQSFTERDKKEKPKNLNWSRENKKLETKKENGGETKKTKSTKSSSKSQRKAKARK